MSGAYFREDLEEVRGLVMEVAGGRVLWEEGIVGTKALRLRLDHAWCASGTRKNQCGCRGWGGKEAHTHTHMYLFIHSTFSTTRGQALSTCTPPTPSQYTRAWELPAHLKHNPGFLKQVLGGYCTRNHAPGVEEHSQLAQHRVGWSGLALL